MKAIAAFLKSSGRERFEEVIGRDRELATFRRLVRPNQKKSILVVSGPSGVGKTLLIDVFARECSRHDSRWARIDFRDNLIGCVDTLRNITQQLDTGAAFSRFHSCLATYTARTCGGGEASYKDQASLKDLQAELLEAFKDDLCALKPSRLLGCRTTLFFDTCEQLVGSELETWFFHSLLPAILLDRACRSNVLFVLSGRSPIRLSEGTAALAERHELQAFSPAMVGEYLAKRLGSSGGKLVAPVLNLTHGHPLNVGILVDLVKTVPEGAAVHDTLDRMSARLGVGTSPTKVSRILVDELGAALIHAGRAPLMMLIKKCAIPRWFDVSHLKFLRLLQPQQHVEVALSYENGIAQLLRTLGTEHPRYQEALVYEYRLRENLKWARRYDDDRLSPERAEIIDHLNELALVELHTSFNQLCNVLVLPEESQAIGSAPDEWSSDEAYLDLGSLREFSFVKPRSLGGYFYHEMVRDAILDGWSADSPSDLRRMQASWVRFYKAKEASADQQEPMRRMKLEELYHLLKCDEGGALALFSQQIENTDSFRDISYCSALADELRSAELRPSSRLWLELYDGYRFLYDGDWRTASSRFRSILNHPATSPKLRALTAYELGKLLAIQGENAEAETLYLQALDLERRQQNVGRVPRILLRLGQVYRWVGRWDEAIMCFDEGLRISEDQDDKCVQGWILLNLGVCHKLQGYLEKAKLAYEQALGIQRQIEDLDGVGRSLRYLCEVYIALGQLGDAERVAMECNETLDCSAQRYSLVRVQIDLAVINTLWGRLERVPYYLDAARDLIDRMNAQSLVPMMESARARYLRALGKPTEALLCLEQCKPFVSATNPLGSAMLAKSTADTLKELGRWPEAEQQYHECIHDLRELKAYYDLSVAEIALCTMIGPEVASSTGAHSRYGDLLEDAKRLAITYGYHDVMARASRLEGDIYLLHGEADRALQAYSLAYREALSYNVALTNEVMTGIPADIWDTVMPKTGSVQTPTVED